MNKVLIIEDDPTTLALYSKMLSKSGFEVVTAEDGEEGLKVLQAESPDAVVLDLTLPKVSGIEVLKAIRKYPKFKKLPVVVFSNAYVRGSIDEGWEAGATKCIVKSTSSPAKLAEVLSNLLSPLPAESPALTTQPSSAPRPATLPRSPGSSPAKILVIDDDKVVLKTLAFTLKSCGYELRTAQDSSEAISLARKWKPDLLVLDINFPPDVAHGGGIPWDGFLILDWIRREEATKDVRTILITSENPERHEARIAAARVSRVLRKPIRPAEIEQAVREALQPA